MIQFMSTTTDKPQNNLSRKVALLPDHKHLLDFTSGIHILKIQDVHYHKSNFKITITFSQIPFSVQVLK